jgi:hypothetical protein
MMPSFALVAISGARRLPPIPIPLFPFWPLVLLCLGVARLLDRDRPEDAAKLRVAMHVFRELRGLEVDVDTEDHKQISIRFV